MEQPIQPTRERTVEHFAVLDGLRGVAAICVVVFHVMEFVTPNYKDNFIAHGFLAVDLFFCLSGFVLAYSYDWRVKQRGALWFMTRRFVRLHPLILLGACLGLASFVLDPFSSLYKKYGLAASLTMTASAATLIPWPSVPERYNNLFYLNPQTWSLLWEYVASLAYALVLVRLSTRWLCALTFVGALVLIGTAAHFGNLAVGWGAENAFGGAARVLYSFVAGVLIYRIGWIPRTSLGLYSVSCVLIAAFLIPWSDERNRILDPVVVIFVFPVLVAVGAGSIVSVTSQKLCKSLGDVSYPLYVIHYPFLWLFLTCSPFSGR